MKLAARVLRDLSLQRSHADKSVPFEFDASGHADLFAHFEPALPDPYGLIQEAHDTLRRSFSWEPIIHYRTAEGELGNLRLDNICSGAAVFTCLSTEGVARSSRARY